MLGPPSYHLLPLLPSASSHLSDPVRVEAHPIPEHPRPWRVKDRAILVGDAAGYVTKCSGEGGVENPMSSDFFCQHSVYIYIFGYPQQKQKNLELSNYFQVWNLCHVFRRHLLRRQERSYVRRDHREELPAGRTHD